jgi:hypothetical protein
MVVALSVASVSGSALAGVGSNPQCQAGNAACVPVVVQEMTNRFEPLASTCSHEAVFALLYLRTTEMFGATLSTIGYGNPASVVREDAQFADYYFTAYDRYHAGQSVPEAWRIAFDAAKQHSVTSLGNAMLGMNAHIRRDLAFTLYDLYVQGHPVSYADHMKVNDFLAQVDATDEIRDRFDDDYDQLDLSQISLPVIIAWRQIAWNNYIALRNAWGPAGRAIVAAGIEADATTNALSIVALNSYGLGSSAERDAYCASTGGH